jgi:excisionase family DNA binding protein
MPHLALALFDNVCYLGLAGRYLGTIKRGFCVAHFAHRSTLGHFLSQLKRECSMPRNKVVPISSPIPEVKPILVNLPTAARMLGTTVWAVREILWAKKIPHVKIGRRFLVSPADLEGYVVQLKAGA